MLSPYLWPFFIFWKLIRLFKQNADWLFFFDPVGIVVPTRLVAVGIASDDVIDVGVTIDVSGIIIVDDAVIDVGVTIIVSGIIIDDDADTIDVGIINVDDAVFIVVFTDVIVVIVIDVS